jgi:hypothetical protein
VHEKGFGGSSIDPCGAAGRIGLSAVGRFDGRPGFIRGSSPRMIGCLPKALLRQVDP